MGGGGGVKETRGVVNLVFSRAARSLVYGRKDYKIINVGASECHKRGRELQREATDEEPS